MDNFEIKIGGAYVKRKNEALIRVVVTISGDGQVEWGDFGCDDGEPIGGGCCSLYAFRQWAGRPATDEERRRLRWARALEKHIESVQRHLDDVPDTMLHDEHRRRNLVSGSHAEMLASQEELRAFLSKVPDEEIALEYKRRKLGRRR